MRASHDLCELDFFEYYLMIETNDEVLIIVLMEDTL